MGQDGTVTRRELLGTTLAIGTAAGLAAQSVPSALAQSAAGTASSAQSLTRGEFVIRGAYILTMDPSLGDVPNGDIHVRNGEIVAVGPNLNAPGAEVIDARTMIAIPGMIETHWHMWGTAARNMAGDDEKTGYFPYSRVLGKVFTPEDNARGVRIGLAEALNGGLTTVNNWSHNLLGPEYADAELQAHRDLGARALFSYGYSRRTAANQTLPLDDVARVQKQWFNGGDGLLTLGIASRGPENNTIDICQQEWDTARKLGIRITCHMGTNAKRVEERQGIQMLDKAGLLGPDLVLVHDTNTNERDLEIVAKTNTPVSLSPFTEMRTGFGFPPILDMLKAGVPVSLSVDTAVLCGNADMFAIMKAMQNVGNGHALSEFGLPARRVLQMATIDGAVALGIADKVGSITPGKRADIVVIRTDDLNMAPFTSPVHMVVQSAQPSNVETVVVDGRILKRNGKLVAVDVPKLVSDVNETMTRVMAEVAKG